MPQLFDNNSIFGRRRVPLILQSEAAECGVACLGMIASYYGFKMDLTFIRQQVVVSLRGTTLRDMIRMAEHFELSSRPLKVEIKVLDHLKLPAILHWELGHFVVLESIAKRGIRILDPAIGRRFIPWCSVDDRYTGIALELSPTVDFVKKDVRERFSILRFISNVHGFKSAVIQIFSLSLALEALVMIAPLYIQWTVDHAVPAADYDLLLVLALGFSLLVFLHATINAFRGWVIITVSTELNFEWLSGLFKHLFRLPLSFFEKRHVGDINSKFNSLSVIQKALTTEFVHSIVDGLLVLGTFGMMLFYSPKLAAISLSFVVVLAIIRITLAAWEASNTTEKIIHNAHQQTHFFETLRSAQSVKLFNRSEERRISWLNDLAREFNSDINIRRINLMHQSSKFLLLGLERILIIFFAARMVLAEQFTIGMLFALLTYKEQFSLRTNELIENLIQFRLLRLHADRLADIIFSPREIEHARLTDSRANSNVLGLNAISFRYADYEPYVLQNVDLTIGDGECIAIIGASGCGKTTIIKILLGLLEPTQGEVSIGGVPIQKYGIQQYRDLIGSVMQEDALFSGSIIDNISFFDTTPDLENIQKCAKMAAIHKDISAMPMAYHSLIGNIGSGLSGGQKQRILLARALYRNPRILVLDEATSHLDADNESRVNDIVKDLQLTRVIVAHRAETIAMADRVINLQDINKVTK